MNQYFSTFIRMLIIDNGQENSELYNGRITSNGTRVFYSIYIYIYSISFYPILQMVHQISFLFNVGGSPPISRRIIIRRIATLDRRVFICVTALAALGVTLALTFLSFNLYYRKLK